MMDRKAVLEEAVNNLRTLVAKMEKHLIDRPDADSRVNAYGKILKGVQLDIMTDVVKAKLSGVLVGGVVLDESEPRQLEQ